MEEEKEKNLPSPKKKNKWSLISFIFGILAILTMPIILFDFFDILDYVFILLPIFSILALIFGIIGLKRGESKALSLTGIILGILLFFAPVFLISQGGCPMQEEENIMVSDMYQLRTKAALYFQEHDDSYVGLENDPEVLELKDDIIKQKGTNFAINISPDGEEYCAEVQVYSEHWWCVDSELRCKKYYNTDPSCSSYHYTCE